MLAASRLASIFALATSFVLFASGNTQSSQLPTEADAVSARFATADDFWNYIRKNGLGLTQPQVLRFLPADCVLRATYVTLGA